MSYPATAMCAVPRDRDPALAAFAADHYSVFALEHTRLAGCSRTSTSSLEPPALGEEISWLHAGPEDSARFRHTDQRRHCGNSQAGGGRCRRSRVLGGGGPVTASSSCTRARRSTLSTPRWSKGSR